MRLRCLFVGLLLAGVARAEEPVHFNDERLKAVVEHALWISDPAPADMLGLTALYANEDEIADLTGLEYAKNLQILELAYNHITDISMLSGLSSLDCLILNNNAVRDISPVSSLTSLEYLDIHNNGLSDVSAIAGLDNLRTLILRLNEITDLSPLSDLSLLEDLDLRENEISDLAGLSGLDHLRRLDLYGNQISDLAPLSGLLELETLVLPRNQIGDISPLSALTGLRALDLERNQITDLSALSSLAGVEELNLYQNSVSDIAPLSALTSLRRLDLQDNPLNEEACDIYIPLIKANNPGLHFAYNTFCDGHLRLSSTAGGTICTPGEGEFTYKRGEIVLIEAQADPCFVFVGFSGSVFTDDNPISVKMDRDYEVCAHFLSVLDILHVDDDGCRDPRPGDATISDPQENGTAEHPFDQIQKAINVAADGAAVFVHAGTYRETIDLLGKHIEVTGFDPASAETTAWPVLDGDGTGPVVSLIHGEGPACRLLGLVITGGADRVAAAVRCTGGSPVFANCLIVGNCASDGSGSVVHCTDSGLSLINCTITDNQAGVFGAALRLDNSPATVVNSILWGNGRREILSTGADEPVIRYSIVPTGRPGPGNLDADPLFVAAGRWVSPDDPRIVVAPAYPGALLVMGDYHAQSQAGRWDPKTGAWLQDQITSPCVDGGDPVAPVGDEPSPNGAIVNLGAYGGTLQASLSLVCSQ